MESINNLNIAGLPKIIFGDGKFSELLKIISSYGSSALIFIGGESLKKSGRFKTLILQLNQVPTKFKFVSVWDEPATEAIDAADSKNSPAVLSKEEIKVILEVVR
ncbi:MAG: iron-containing alcohol dehydrogenase [Smithella sp.]